MRDWDVHNMFTIIDDTTSNFTPGAAAVSIVSEPPTVHDMLMQRSNGTFIWATRVERLNCGHGIFGAMRLCGYVQD
jgi:hypothetical protein